jgi:hypothetical protein
MTIGITSSSSGNHDNLVYFAALRAITVYCAARFDRVNLNVEKQIQEMNKRQKGRELEAYFAE